jgi:cob(I)alamin adenosyltransferase
VELSKKGPSLRKILLKYINRLSSFLYILEIYTIQAEGNTKPSLAKKKAA